MYFYISLNLKKSWGTFIDQKLAESQFTVAHDLQYTDSWHTKNQILKIDILVLKSDKIEFFNSGLFQLNDAVSSIKIRLKKDEFFQILRAVFQATFLEWTLKIIKNSIFYGKNYILKRWELIFDLRLFSEKFFHNF